ncbi:MAG: DinB family protein [Candidatus Latescibacteria bacterium]|nr:DinB family protein [Candidatus Latescibacterota bacterium]
MDTFQRLYRLFAYDTWANRETLASLNRAGTPPVRSLRWMGHIIAAEWLWLGRLKQERSPIAVWPDLALADCDTHLTDLQRHWQDYLHGLAPDALAQRIAYTNTQGESWANTVEDILLHIVMHSTYHRGQIAADLRPAGQTPAYTDFIHAIRRGFVE